MRILLTSDNVVDPCALYRLTHPFTKIRGHDFKIIESDKIQPQDLWWMDLMIFLRPQSSTDLNWIKAAKKLGKKVWMDFDDDFTSIPVDHPSHASYTSVFFESVFQQILILPDLITVSTDALAYSLSQKTPMRIEVIKNGIDTSLTPIAPHNADSKVLAWRGTSSHHLEALELIEVAKHYGQEYEWALFGQVPYALVEAITPFVARVRPFPPMDFLPMLETLRALKPRAIFSPLFVHLFNSAKSNCVFLEALSFGAVTCAPKEIPEFNLPGIVDWKDRLTFLHQSSSEIFIEAERTARDNYGLCALNLKREALLAELT